MLGAYSVTCQSTVSRGSYSTVNIKDLSATEIEKPRLKPLGFCTDIKCQKVWDRRYKISAKVFAFVTDKKRLLDCPSCGHALYWSTQYDSDPIKSNKDLRKLYLKTDTEIKWLYQHKSGGNTIAKINQLRKKLKEYEDGFRRACYKG